MNAFKLPRFHVLVVLQCVRWYGKYAVSYRQLEEMMAERSVVVSVIEDAAEELSTTHHRIAKVSFSKFCTIESHISQARVAQLGVL